MIIAVTRRLLLAHLATQAIFVAVLWHIPVGGWGHSTWQTLAGWSSAGFLMLGVRHFQPEGARAWRIIGAGMFLSAAGNTAEMIAWRCCDVTTNPNPADVLWLTLHLSLLVGLGLFVYRRAASEEVGTNTLLTIACVLLNLFAGVFAWQGVVWRPSSDQSLTLANRFIVTLYPLADLMLMGLCCRLLLAGLFRNASVLLISAGLALFGAADLGWSDFLRGAELPDRTTEYIMEATSLVARALLGAATLVPSVRSVIPPVEGEHPRLSALGWLGLAASALTAPLVLLLQALLDRLYAVSSF
jgi:hypothetical protein